MPFRTILTAATLIGIMSAAASADIHVFPVSLDGSQEVPPSGSPGTGTATITVDDVTGEVTITGSYEGLLTAANAAHLHGLAPPGEDAGILIGLGVSGGTTGTFGGGGTLDSTNLAGLFDELTYLNVHTTGLPGGEIRGQVFVPEPASLGMLAGAFALLLRRRGR